MGVIVDLPAIIQVIGSVYLDNSLLDNEEYFFTENDFTQEFHKILFGAIYNLHNLGVEKITAAVISDYLAQRPSKLAIYKNNKGDEYLERLKEITQITSFKYYYNRVKKMTLLRAFQAELGMDLSWIYDADNILDIKKKQRQEEWLDNSSLEGIIETIEKRIEHIKINNSAFDNEATVSIGEGVDELLSSLEESPDVGLPLFGDLINSVHRGARLKKFYLRSATTNVGKALDNESLIPTPLGWTKVKNIKKGDYLFSKNGHPTKVLQVFPQQTKKQVYMVIFEDGRKVRCCKNHLWEIHYKEFGKDIKNILSTQAIIEKAKQNFNGFKNENNNGYKYKIPINDPVQYATKDFPLAPYIVGLLLGNSSFVHFQNKDGNFVLLSKDNELPEIIAKNCDWNYIQDDSCEHIYRFKYKGKKQLQNVKSDNMFVDCVDLQNAQIINKCIPEIYLLGNINQRLQLLQGLLDANGTIGEGGEVSFFTTNIQLKNQMLELCYSLGLKVNIKVKSHTQMEWQLLIQSSQEMSIKLFCLKEKKEAIQKAKTNTQYQYVPFLCIKAIIPIDEEVNMTCFVVDNEEHLFLANNYIVTHNTRTMIADACTLGAAEIYNIYKRKWERGCCQPTLFIATEQECREIQLMMLSFIADVEEEHIADNQYEDNEKDRVLYAAKILKTSPIYLIELSDFSTEDIENTIKYNIRAHDVRYVFFDYLHSSIKILSEITSKAKVKGLREDNVLFMLSNKLKNLCNQYGIFILTSTQLNGDYRNTNVFDQNLLSGSKAVANKADWGAILLETTSKDKAALSDVLMKNGLDMPEIKMSIYKNRRTKYKNILLWCRKRLGSCRIEPLFATNYNYEIIDIPNLKIEVFEK